MKGGKPFTPKARLLLDPLRCGIEWGRDKLEVAHPPLLSARHDSGVLQDAKVLRNRGKADRKRCGELAHRGVALAEPAGHPAPGGVSECLEDSIKLAIAKLNHRVKY